MLPPTHKLVLLALAHLANASGRSSPSVSTLAASCGVSTRTIRRTLRDLEADGLLHTEPQLRDDGSTKSNRYALRLAEGHAAAGPPDTHVTGLGQPPSVTDDTTCPGYGLHPRELNRRAMAAEDSATPLGKRTPDSIESVTTDSEGGILIDERDDRGGAASAPGGQPYKPSAPLESSASSTAEKPFAFLRSVIGS